MYYNDDFRSSDQYRYTNRDQLPHDDYAPGPNRAPAPAPESPKKQGFFHRTAVKVTALILACAVAGGLAGWGGAAIAGSSTSRTAIQQSSRQPVSVQVKNVDGQTKMEPAEVYASVVNSAVSINCSATSTNIFGQQTQTASSGSGFIITEDGYVVTNYHVVSGASSVEVTLYNGDTYDATVIGGDSDYDVAVLKINASGLQPVTLGESADVNVGDTVLAIGNPLGELTFSMSQGIVSAKYSTYSSTTVEGLGFAIPISDVRSIITDIMENGAVTDKAYMAITAGTMNEQMAAQFNIDVTEGVFVYSVVEGGAGDKAGLRLGDVITKMNDKTLTSRQDLSAAMKGYRAGDTVTLTVYRGGQYIEVELTFDTQPQTTGSDDSSQSSDNSYGYGNGGNSYGGQMPDNFQEFYNYFFGNRG